MEHSTHRRIGSARRPTVAKLALAAAAMLLLAALCASPAAAIRKAEREEFLPFADCPLASAGLCVVADTTGGEFVIGRKTVPITKPILLQGGLPKYNFEEQSLVAAVGGETLAKVPQEVPGGLLGIGGLGGEVTATAELAGPVSSVHVNGLALAFPSKGIYAVVLPLKVKLSNEVLGNDCYIGSEAEPIVLHLTDGKTYPPEGVEPIEGSHSEFEGPAKGRINRVPAVKLVDNTFSVPGAKGCGSSGDEALIDEVLNLDVGLPSKAGSNKAIMSGSVEQSAAALVAEDLPKPKKEKKKK
jgi:hypothetical protein